jgi:uncharacterized damage-inducible protein DinB
VKTLEKMFAHLNWANERILQALHGVESENNLSTELFAHILLAEQVWLSRLHGSTSAQVEIWGETSLEVCKELNTKNKKDIESYLHNLTENDLEKVITYKNSKNKIFHSTVGDILIHVALHGQYHRGQINRQLRLEGNLPVGVDYISYVRNEF